MSSALAEPSLPEYVARLTPAQARHLRLVIDNDDVLPPIIDSVPTVDQSVSQVPSRPGLRALIGSLSDAPADLRSNADHYLTERAARHGIARA